MIFERKENQDLGGKPCLIDIHNEALSNENFRKAIWTGKYLQVTVMSIPAGGEIGLEMHDDVDQFIKIESGCANVYFGDPWMLYPPTWLRFFRAVPQRQLLYK